MPGYHGVDFPHDVPDAIVVEAQNFYEHPTFGRTIDTAESLDEAEQFGVLHRVDDNFINDEKWVFPTLAEAAAFALRKAEEFNLPVEVWTAKLKI